MYAKIVNEETKQCEVGLGTNSAFYQSIGMTEMEVEEAYNHLWYIKGYAPEKPAKETAQEKITELKAQLVATDYVANKLIEAYALNDMELFEMYRAKYKDKIEERKAIRAKIDELEEMING